MSRANSARPAGQQSKGSVIKPVLGSSGPCVVCGKPDLSTVYWCMGCGNFVCIVHDAEGNIPKAKEVGATHHTIDAHRAIAFAKQERGQRT